MILTSKEKIQNNKIESWKKVKLKLTVMFLRKIIIERKITLCKGESR